MPVPNLQINEARTIAVVDRYIRTRLFGQPFNPFNGSDWKILLSKDAIVTKHIKCIYERLGYPSSRGGFEKAFIMFLNTDGEVERFLKISENMHPFAVIYYMRKDGLMATYHPDFIVATQNKIYLIETKGNDKLFDKNVRQKQTAAVEWTRKINELKPDERMDREWEYVLISEDNFYGLSHNGATITDICDRCKVSLSAAMGELFV